MLRDALWKQAQVRKLLHVPLHHDELGVVDKGWAARQQLEEKHARAVDVGRGGRVTALDLLGAHVLRGPDGRAVARHARTLLVVRDAEVGDLRGAVRVEQDVAGLQVTVDEPGIVDGLEPGKKGRRERLDFGPRKRTPLVQSLLERPPFEHLQHERRSPAKIKHVVEPDHVPVIDGRERPRLLLDSARDAPMTSIARVEDLQRNGAVQPNVERLEYLAHGSITDQGDDLVAAAADDRASREIGHRRPRAVESGEADDPGKRSLTCAVRVGIRHCRLIGLVSRVRGGRSRLLSGG